MSMLAEKKIKQKWILNPRGNAWSKDSNKFGQKLLEKMGWTPGKGLGANEDGITEHVKVKYKNDSNGIGYDLRDDQWTAHESNFTDLLKNLGSNETITLDKPKPEKSLEKISQISRARVHYHKYTRGKDLSIRSEKDLANIFGRKTLQVSVEKEEKEQDDKAEKDIKTFGVVTIKSGNMTDYFKSKLNKLGKFSLTNNKEIDASDSESETRTTFGFGFSTTDKQNFVDFVSPIQNETKLEENNIGFKRKRNNTENDDFIKEKKKKIKKKHVAFDNKGNDINIKEEVSYDNPCLNKEYYEEQQTIEENGLDNPAFNDEPEKKTRKSVTFASPLVEYSTINDESVKKKKKKMKKQEKGIDNLACEEQSPESNIGKENVIESDIDTIEITPVKKVKRKKKNFETGIENFGCEELSPQTSTVNEDTKISKKNKKKRKSLENGITNLACEETLNCADNLGCSVNLIEEGIESITNAIDNYQTELENEMNQRKDKKIQKEHKLKSKKTNNFM